MDIYFLTFRSVTPAQRGEALLRKHGIAVTLQRTPRWMEEKGCGYALRLQRGSVTRVVELLREANVAFRKIYRQNPGGNVEETEV